MSLRLCCDHRLLAAACLLLRHRSYGYSLGAPHVAHMLKRHLIERHRQMQATPYFGNLLLWGLLDALDGLMNQHRGLMSVNLCTVAKQVCVDTCITHCRMLLRRTPRAELPYLTGLSCSAPDAMMDLGRNDAHHAARCGLLV